VKAEAKADGGHVKASSHAEGHASVKVNMNVNMKASVNLGTFDIRAKFDAGYLMVTTDKPFYEPGEQITGKIFVRCTRPVDAKHVELEVKGKEKASFVEHEVKRSNNPDGTIKQEWVDVKRKADKKIMEFS
jgi:hypothetical protein